MTADSIDRTPFFRSEYVPATIGFGSGCVDSLGADELIANEEAVPADNFIANVPPGQGPSTAAIEGVLETAW